jgi:hypothetical protein
LDIQRVKRDPSYFEERTGVKNEMTTIALAGADLYVPSLENLQRFTAEIAASVSEGAG